MNTKKHLGDTLMNGTLTAHLSLEDFRQAVVMAKSLYDGKLDALAHPMGPQLLMMGHGAFSNDDGTRKRLCETCNAAIAQASKERVIQYDEAN